METGRPVTVGCSLTLVSCVAHPPHTHTHLHDCLYLGIGLHEVMPPG